MLRDAAHTRQIDEQGAVIAMLRDPARRIVRQLQAAAGRLGLTPVDDAALLDEVTALVECGPTVLACRFDEQFPRRSRRKCLILTAKVNQKYFPLLDAAGA